MIKQKPLWQEVRNDVHGIWNAIDELWNHGLPEEKAVGLPIAVVGLALSATGVCAVARAIDSRMQEHVH